MTTDNTPPPLTATPIAASERIDVLDVIRGFALLGILLMNIEWFQRPIAALGLGMDPTQQGFDRVVGWFIFTFVQGKFYTMFSLLFGMGFVIFLTRAERAGRAATRLFVRRLLVLLAIGVAHGTLLWAGDILNAYAVIGFGLLSFRNSPPKRLLQWFAVFFGLLLAMMCLMQVGLAFDTATRQMAADPAALAKLDETARTRILAHAKTDAPEVEIRRQVAEYAPVYASGTYREVTRVRTQEFVHSLAFLPFFFPSVLSMFLLGAWFVRSGTVTDPAAHAGRFRHLMQVGLGAGIPLALLASHLVGDGNPFTGGWRGFGGSMLMFVANLALCLGYIGALVMLWLSPSTRRWVSVLAPAGRMALTHYLMHAAVLSTLFYGYGFGWWGTVPRAHQAVLALVLYAAQLALSVWWLSRYRYGPMEWLWRSATYGRLQPMRR
jgi:uncharacterized protein